MQRNQKSIKALRNVKCFLLDMDGTIYLDTVLFDGTLDFLAELKKQGKKYFYITNNSSKGTDGYVKKLENIGIKSTADEFFTSAHALVYYLNKEKPGARLYVLGTEALTQFLADNGFGIVREYTKDPEKMPDFAIMGFDLEMTYEKLRIFCDYLMDGVRYWATHPDMVCPNSPYSVPDAGSFMLLVEGATGRKPEFVAGKPNPCMVNMCAEKMGLRKNQVAVIGDRLNTDIKSAQNAGVISVCVLSGEATLEDIEKLPEDQRPDYVFDSIKDVYESLL